MRFTRPLLLSVFLTMAACSDFPELDGVVPANLANSSFPDLVPLDPLVARAQASDAGAAFAETDIAPRLAALRARAARLRGPVLSAPVRARMLRGMR